MRWNRVRAAPGSCQLWLLVFVHIASATPTSPGVIGFTKAMTERWGVEAFCYITKYVSLLGFHTALITRFLDQRSMLAD